MAVDVGRARLRLLGPFAGWHNRDRPHGMNGCTKFGCVARHVGKRPLWRFGQSAQQRQRWRKLVCLPRYQQEIEQSPGCIADANYLCAETATRTPERFTWCRNSANESQSQLRCLADRAPEAFWCARAMVPSMQANPNCGSPCATT